MKRNNSFLIAAFAALTTIGFIASTGNEVSFFKNAEQGEEMENGFSEEAGEWVSWEYNRLVDPETGKIPDHVRQKELAYAATLPSSELPGFQKANSLTWVNRGPWNLGGRTRAFAIDITNESVLFAGSASGGMWRSVDAGTTWVNTTPQAQFHGPTCIVQDKRNNKKNTWYYGTGEGYGTSASGGGAFYLGNGIYKSLDGGQTWTSLPSTASNTPQVFENFFDIVWNVKTDVKDTVNDVVYAATLGSIMRTVDGGVNWTSVRGGNLNNYSYFTDVEVTPGGIVYATLSSDGPDKGIWRSVDGVNFTKITPSNFPTTYNRLVIGYAPGDESQVYILGNTPGFGQPDTNFQGDVEWNSLWKYKYLSGNGDSAGGIWEDRSLSLPTTGGWFDKFNCQGSYDLVVKVKPNDTNTVFIGGTNVYRSTDAFVTPNNTTYIGGYKEHAALPVVDLYANHHPDQHDLCFLPSDPNKMYSVNDGGVFRTDDNTAPQVAWTSKNNGYLTSMFYTVAVDHGTPNNNIIIGGAQDNGSWFTNSLNPVDPWVTPRGGDGSYCAIANGRFDYYFSIQNGKIMKAKLDAAGTVTQFARIDPIGAKGYQFINPFVLDPNNNNLMYLCAGKRIWRNNDLSSIPYASNYDSISTNWYPFTDSLGTGAATSITALSISKFPANILYYGTNARKIFKVTGANLTPNPTPVLVSNNTLPNSNVSCLAVDPHDANKVIAVFSNYGVQSLFSTVDGGANWVKIGGNLEPVNGTGPSCRWATIAHVGNATAWFVGTSTGLYATTFLNGVNTVWVLQAANEIGNQVCDMMDFRESDGLLVVATHSQGIFSTNITNVDQVGVPKINEGTNELNLVAYPNPFNETATIEFTLDRESSVQLLVTDELGRPIQVLANERLTEGKHSFRFSKGNLSAGVYYLSLMSDERRRSKQLVIY